MCKYVVTEIDGGTMRTWVSCSSTMPFGAAGCCATRPISLSEFLRTPTGQAIREAVEALRAPLKDAQRVAASRRE